jgi:transposase
MKITAIGIDLLKSVFAVHGVNEHGREVLKKVLKRDQVAKFFANLQPCLIGMEACGSAHHWARKLQGFGHDVRLIAPQFVKPYVKTNKNDAADAEAICEAVARPNMRFVPVKNVEQQAVLAQHGVRQGFIKARTAQANQIRGLLAEFGLIIPQGIANIAERVPELLEDATNELPGSFRLLVQRLMEHLKELDRQAGEIEAQIVTWHRDNELSRKLAEVPGIGPITASALVATVSDAAPGAEKSQCGCRCASQQECAHRVGTAGSRPRVPARLHERPGERVTGSAAKIRKQQSSKGDSNHRLLRRSSSDGKTGQTVVDQDPTQPTHDCSAPN